MISFSQNSLFTKVTLFKHKSRCDPFTPWQGLLYGGPSPDRRIRLRPPPSRSTVPTEESCSSLSPTRPLGTWTRQISTATGLFYGVCTTIKILLHTRRELSVCPFVVRRYKSIVLVSNFSLFGSSYTMFSLYFPRSPFWLCSVWKSLSVIRTEIQVLIKQTRLDDNYLTDGVSSSETKYFYFWHENFWRENQKWCMGLSILVYRVLNNCSSVDRFPLLKRIAFS